MSEKLIPISSRLTVADLTPEWQKRTKYACSLPGVSLRGVGLEIHCYLHHSSKQWMPLLLPNGQTEFQTELDRDEAIEMLGFSR